MNALTAGTLLCLAGGVAAASTPQLAPRGTMPTREAAHLYINAATGEVVATHVGEGAAVVRGLSPEVWVADNRLPCAAFGQTGGTSAVVDDPSEGTVGDMFSDWGDIPADTVVDAVRVTWGTQHQDTDADGDGVGDGVEGFGASWSWQDGDNGYYGCIITPIVGFTLSHLPGVVGPVDPNLFTVYYATVDLASSFDSSITFEIGDTDFEPQGAAHHNPGFFIGDLDSDTVADGDLDGDGLADFSYTQRFHQPGTMDFNGDGVPDGDPNAAAMTGIRLVAPSGTTVFDGTDYFIDPVDALPAGQGMEDVFDVYSVSPHGFLQYAGTYFYGGFSCDPADPNPYAQFEHILYGPGGGVVCCPPDLNCDGLINFFDISIFLQAFDAQDPVADFAAPFGVFNFVDISAFLSAYNTGCP